MSDIDNDNHNIIKHYILKEKLGTGSYGVVYKVFNKNDKNTYVLKQISLFSMDKIQIEEVKNESNILSSLNSKYVVKYFDSFIENNCLNIVMEYCDGGDLGIFLKQALKTGKFIPEEKIWKFFIQICLGLQYIHSKNILHRDLKTMNIFMIKENEQIRIGDLGVAKALNPNSFAKTFVGTPYYLSPEICEEKPYNEKSDVWALGCILYEMATYKHPFNATNQGALILKILKGTYEPINTKEYSIDLKKTIEKLLEKMYDKRPFIKDILKDQIVIKKVKQYNLSELMIEEGYGSIFKKERQESNKNLINLSNNNLNVSNLNLEKFKKLAANNNDPKKADNGRFKNLLTNENINEHEKNLKEKGLAKNLKLQQINSKKIGNEILLKNFQNRPQSRAQESKDPNNNLKNLHNKKNSNVVDLSPVNNIRKSENFKPVNVNNLLNKEKPKDKNNNENFGKEADLDTDKLKKRLAEIENIMNNIDKNNRIINNPEHPKKEEKLNNKKTNAKNKLNNLNIKKFDINNNLNIQGERKSNNEGDLSSVLIREELKSSEYRQTTDSTKLYAIDSAWSEKGIDSVNMYKHSNLLAEFSENYKAIDDIKSDINFQAKDELNKGVVEGMGSDTMNKNTAYFLNDKLKATDFIEGLIYPKSDFSDKNLIHEEKQNLIIIKDEKIANKKPISSNKNLDHYKILEPNTNINLSEQRLDNKKINALKYNNTPSTRISNKNIKKDNLVFENNFMKNIRIDEKKIDQAEVNVSVNKSYKKDNKFETYESKKENIMKVPKVFQIKYYNLAEKKTNSKNNIDSNPKETQNENLNKKINDEITESNQEKKENIKNEDPVKKCDLISKNESNKESKAMQRPSLIRDNKKNNRESVVLPANKILSLIKKKVDIIDNVPLFSNNEHETEESFIINVPATNEDLERKSNSESNQHTNNQKESITHNFKDDNEKAIELDNQIECKIKNKNNDISQENQLDHSDRDYYNTENEEDEYEEEETEEQSEETNSSYENEEVVVMKDTNLNSSKEIKLLEEKRVEYKEKMDTYKVGIMEKFGEEKSSKIFSFYYKKIYNNNDEEASNNNELLEELGKLMTDTFPENYLNVIIY